MMLATGIFQAMCLKWHDDGVGSANTRVLQNGEKNRLHVATFHFATPCHTNNLLLIAICYQLKLTASVSLDRK